MILGTIAVEGIEVFAHHGVFTEEREQGNVFWVDVYLKAPIDAAGRTDELAQTVDYQQIYDLVIQRMSQPVDLLETLVLSIGREILDGFASVIHARVRVTKKQPFTMEKCKHTSVEASFPRMDAGA